MKPKMPLAIAAVVCAAVVAFLWFEVGSDREPDSDDIAGAGTPVSGFVVHIDPATGRVVEPSPQSAPVIFGEEWRNALSTSSEGLVEETSPIEAGGVMVDLRGRFHNAMVTVISEGGEVSSACVSDPLGQAAGDNGEERE